MKVKRIVSLLIFFISLSLNLQANEREDFVRGLYQNAFEREPDTKELSYWTKRIEENLSTATSMALSFYKSEEFKAKELQDREFVKTAYKIFFDREGESEGVEYWSQKLKEGYSKEQLFYHFALSDEFKIKSIEHRVPPYNIDDKKRAFISRFYALILSRDSDEEGMEYWTKELQTPKDSYKIVKDFLFSEEFENRNISNEEFIKILYRVFFDREPDQEGLDFWLQALKERGKKWVIEAMMESQEFEKLTNEIFKKESFSFPPPKPKFPQRVILKTGQTQSYAAFDDGYYQKGADLNYSRDDENGIVIDHTSKLMWQDNVKDGGEMLVFDEAKKYCENLSLGGYDDWRLPTIEELVNLEAFRYLPNWRYSFPKAFTQVDSWKFWSQDSYIGDNNYGWVVCYGQGFSRLYPKSTKFHTRCVRGEGSDLKNPIFKRDDEKDIVEELTSNLMWQDNEAAKSVKLSWYEVLDYCENLSLGGYDDWRVPNAKELFMIGDRSKRSPSIYPNFKNVANSFYWSSTTYQRFDDEGWRVEFNTGKMEHTKKDSTGYIRCVRDKK